MYSLRSNILKPITFKKNSLVILMGFYSRELLSGALLMFGYDSDVQCLFAQNLCLEIKLFQFETIPYQNGNKLNCIVIIHHEKC